MSREPVIILDCATNQEVEAVLDTDVPLVRLVEVEQHWMPFRLEALRQYALSPGTVALPQQVHWNWAFKLFQFDPAVHQILEIEMAGEPQGLMWISRQSCTARLPPDVGQALVYVDYVETAPWNAREYTASPRYKGVGSRLIEAAVMRSVAEGHEGRLGLHSLPQSEGFYNRGCGMICCGPDPEHQSLVYFEFTAADANVFLSE
jgi:hypothetical protein